MKTPIDGLFDFDYELAINDKSADPYPFYHDLRQTSPLWRVPQGYWLVTTHADSLALLCDPKCDHWGQKMSGESGDDSTRAALAESLLALSPDRAGPVRLAVMNGLSCRNQDELMREMSDRADEILRSLRPRDAFDAVSDYAHPFTFGSICRVMGVPSPDIPTLCETAAKLQGKYIKYVSGRFRSDLSDGPMKDFIDYFQKLLMSKRRDPGDDLISALIAQLRTEQAAQANDRLLLSLTLLLLYAGHQNMMNFIGNAILALARNPESCAPLRRNPELIDDLVIELLRFDSPVQHILLVAREEITLHGRSIKPGEIILVGVGAANRDPDAFANPDELDIDRRPKTQLAFGAGAYRCIGARLAQIQAATVLDRFLAHIADFHVTQEQLRWHSSPIIQRGLQALPLSVRWIN